MGRKLKGLKRLAAFVCAVMIVMTAVSTDFGKTVSGMLEVWAADDAVKNESSIGGNVIYRTHVQTYGWQNYVKNGATAGTTGQAKRLEGITIQLQNQTQEGDIEYRTHVQTYGWQDWVKNGSVSGTSGQAKRLEAVQIRLTDKMSENYDIYYRVHAQHFGWLGWAKNGESAGTEGYAYRLEAIEIRLTEKGEKAPGSTDNCFYEKDKTTVEYRTHVQSYGWQNYVRNGSISGTTGKAKRLEGINIRLADQSVSGNIEYQTHVQTYGWQNWVQNGSMSGTSGQAKRLEAIRIRLTDKMSENYDIYYRVHAQHFGWLGWAKNGEPAGTEGYAYRLEAIEIRLVKKGEKAPGSTQNSYYKDSTISAEQARKMAEEYWNWEKYKDNDALIIVYDGIRESGGEKYHAFRFRWWVDDGELGQAGVAKTNIGHWSTCDFLYINIKTGEERYYLK